MNIKKLSIKSIISAVVTLGPLGYLPFSGTIGSLCSLAFIMYLFYFSLITIPICVCILCAIISFFIIRKAYPYFLKKDPREIILDEVVGIMVVFAGLGHLSLSIFFIGFLLFRFFDITKIIGISYIERLPGAFGILCDDILAGIYAKIVLLLLIKYVGL